MGRRKLEMKKITDKQSRQVTFTKRRGGLIKKARELSVLCDVDVTLLVFSARGKLFEFSSSPSITQVIQRYNSHCETEGMNSTSDLGAEFGNADFLTSSELLEIVERQLEEPHVDRLSAQDLALIESQIDAALVQIRYRKTQLMLDSITALHEKEKMLREENNRLVDELDVVVTDRNNTGKELAVDFSLVNDHMDSYAPRLTLGLL